MEEDWKCIYRTRMAYQAEILQGALESHGIAAVVMNKQDSAYLIGEAELYVKAEDVLEANRIINEQEEH
jgi:hypothetical protein